MTPGAGGRWRPVGVAALVALATAVLGGAVTDVGPWYRDLPKPAWTPPDWVFGPAWTLIYTLTAWAAVRCWRAAIAPGAQRRVILGFGLNAALNVGWSVVFFGLRRPDWALLEVALLWGSIAGLIVQGRRVPGCVVLLLPYLAWVSFAAALNAAIVLQAA